MGVSLKFFQFYCVFEIFYNKIFLRGGQSSKNDQENAQNKYQ